MMVSPHQRSEIVIQRYLRRGIETTASVRRGSAQGGSRNILTNYRRRISIEHCYKLIMKLRFWLAGQALTAVVAIAPISAMAGTIAYVGGGLLSGSVEACLKNMKTAADKNGFTESQETIMSDNKKEGDFHADHKDSPMHFTGSCAPNAGVWSIGVSGIDNDKTFEMYGKVWKAIP